MYREFVVKRDRSFDFGVDIADKALMVCLEPNNSDRSGCYLKRDDGYKINGTILTILHPDIEPGDKIEVLSFEGDVLSEEEYRTMLCDPRTWHNKSQGLYLAADVIIGLFKRDMASIMRGIIPEEPEFHLSMLDSWLLLMAFAIENAAKGIIVANTIEKNSSLKEKATLDRLNIKGHDIENYLRRAFKAKNNKIEFMELKLAEDLSAYAEFAVKYEIGTSYKATIPNNIIMHSTPPECFELGYFDIIINLYLKLDKWLIDDVQEAQMDDY
jgi:hypothetical protein